MKSPLKIVLLLNSSRMPFWQYKVIEYIASHPGISVVLTVVNNSPHSAKVSFWYRLLRAADRFFFRTSHDAFQKVDASPLLVGVPLLQCEVIQKKFTDTFHPGDIQSISACQPDVILRFGFRILKGDILNLAGWGVWSLHHGDNMVNRGGPPAFWEVVNREEVTGVTLQQLSDTLDGGIIIDKAFVCTNATSFNRNQNTLYWAGVELLCNALHQLAKGSEMECFPLEHRLRVPSQVSPMVSSMYSYPLYRNPSGWATIQIAVKFGIQRLFNWMVQWLRRPQWSIYFHFKGHHSTGSETQLLADNESGHEVIESNIYRYQKLSPPSGSDWADPFVIKRQGRFFLFFEELSSYSKKAHISCIEFDSNGKINSAPQVVLKEPFHLSYPFVFTDHGKIYLLPEAAESNQVWLYEAVDFPHTWRKRRMLMDNVAFYDPTLIKWEGFWYLFGTQKPFEGCSPHQYLYIYYTDDLMEGEWKPHPGNPLVRDVRGARPAGRIFKSNGKLIRPAQIGAPVYGYGIRFFEVVRLSPEAYEEKAMNDLLPRWKKGLRATHTFNFDDGFCVLDAQQ